MDGWIARKYHTISLLGQRLDPLADKIFFFCLAVFLMNTNMYFLILYTVFITRDLVILFGALYLSFVKKNVVLYPSVIGKWHNFLLLSFTTLILYLMTISQPLYYVFNIIGSNASIDLTLLSYVALSEPTEVRIGLFILLGLASICLVTTFLSGLDYAWRVKKIYL